MSRRAADLLSFSMKKMVREMKRIEGPRDHFLCKWKDAGKNDEW